jgi:putative transposase
MIQLIEDHRDDHGVEPICRVLPIAPATFYDNMAKRADPSRLSDRAKRDAELKPEIERGFEQNLKVYSVRKVWRQMHREGFGIARCTVARLMKDIGNEGAIRGKRPRTTIPDKALPCPLDRVNRQFHASAPNVLWVSDFTYVATWQGFVYVAFVIDVFARRIFGWCASRTANAGFVLDALEQAIHQRRPAQDQPVHHSDRGSQYLSIKYTERLQRRRLYRQSAASGIPMTMPWPKRSTVYSRLKSSTGVGHGAALRSLNTPPWNGSIGSTIAACWSLSGISCQLKQRQTSMPLWKDHMAA